MASNRDAVFSPCLNRSCKSTAESPQECTGSGLVTSPSDEKVQSIDPSMVVELKPAVDSALANNIVSRHDTSAQLDKDPFVTPIRGARLSPTASAFTPVCRTGSSSEIPTFGSMSPSLSNEIGLSHFIEISSTASIKVEEVEAWLLRVELAKAPFFNGRQILASQGHLVIHFVDIRDALFVHDNFTLDDKTVNIVFSGIQRSRDLCTTTVGDAAIGSAQVLVMVGSPASLNIHVSHSTDTVVRLLEAHGRLFAFVKQAVFPDGSFQAIAEYCSTAAAKTAVQLHPRGGFAAGLHLTVRPLGEDDPASGPNPHGNRAADGEQSTRHIRALHARDSMVLSHVPSGYPVHPLVFSPRFQGYQPVVMERCSTRNTGAFEVSLPMTPMSPGYPLLRSMYQTPPSSATTSQYTQSPSRPAPGSHDGRRQNATRVHRSPNSVGSHHNHVDTARIRGGIDVRTTIMLRNIPNKVDQGMLKRLVDESSWGKYDFMYLRIDFANDCNVGYAFINFVDPLDIVDFVMARGNQRWNCFKSDKIAEISYATIQGKDCLVQKFRNSSVMLEAPHYRPKLYFTSNGPMPDLAGEEEPFPEPDNQSKMKRSCENAEHVGLFTPNAGQHFRDEQRRRRSQYDRGTRLAALEEYDYETAIQQLCRISSD